MAYVYQAPLEASSACEGERGSYMAHWLLLDSGNRISPRGPLGIGEETPPLPGSDEFPHFIGTLLEHMNEDDRRRLAMLSVKRLCILSKHSATEKAATGLGQLERVFDMVFVKPDSDDTKIEKPCYTILDKGLPHQGLLLEEPFQQHLQRVAWIERTTLEEQVTMRNLQEIREAATSVPTYQAYIGLFGTELVVPSTALEYVRPDHE